MVKHITQRDVSDVPKTSLEETLGIKGGKLVEDVIKDALYNNKKIICIGGQGTGKTLVLKTILKLYCSFEEKETCDGANDKESYDYLLSNKCKYGTANANDIETFVHNITTLTNIDKIPNCIVLTTSIDEKHKYVKTVHEINNIYDDTIVEEIIHIHKDRYHK